MKLTSRQQAWIAGPLSLSVRLLGSTWRVRRIGFPVPGPDAQCIDALYHGHMLFCISIYRFQRCVTMISDHRDGRMIAEVVRRLGGDVAHGSSTRGGVRAYLNMLKNHPDVGWIVTPDGPRGPRGSVQEGVIKMAADSGRAIRPLGYAASFAKRFRSWDEFTVPYPFSRVVQFGGDPLHVPGRVHRSERQELAHELERRLREANQQAGFAMAKWLRMPEPEATSEDADTQTEG